jgi:hypothetical protein
VILYAVNLIGVLLSGAWMFADARRAGLSRVSDEEAEEGQQRALIVAGIFLISIPIAYLNASLAPYCWLALFIPTFGFLVRKRRS